MRINTSLHHPLLDWPNKQIQPDMKTIKLWLCALLFFPLGILAQDKHDSSTEYEYMNKGGETTLIVRKNVDGDETEEKYTGREAEEKFEALQRENHHSFTHDLNNATFDFDLEVDEDESHRVYMFSTDGKDTLDFRKMLCKGLHNTALNDSLKSLLKQCHMKCSDSMIQRNTAMFHTKMAHFGEDMEHFAEEWEKVAEHMNSTFESLHEMDVEVDETENEDGSITITIKKTITIPPAKSGEMGSATDTFKDANVQFFPNPAKDMVKIQWETAEPTRSAEIVVRDLSGKVVFRDRVKHKQHYKLELKALQPGTYVVSVDSGEWQHTERLVVE